MLQSALRFWHRFLAPALPPACRFYPSCSVYAVEALEKHRFLRATGLILWRLARCQPFGRGGFDPVPDPPTRPGYRSTEEPCERNQPHKAH